MAISLRLPDNLKRYQETFIYAGIFILGLIISVCIFISQKAKIKNTNERIATENARLDVGGQVIVSAKKISEIGSPFVKRRESLGLQKITEIAGRAGLTIISQEEAERKDMFFITNNYRIKLQAGTYHFVGKFISELESRPELLQMNRLLITRNEAVDPAEPSGLSVEADLEVRFIK